MSDYHSIMHEVYMDARAELEKAKSKKKKKKKKPKMGFKIKSYKNEVDK